MTESDLTRLVKRVIKEQAAAKTPDLEAIKKQIVGKKVGLTATGVSFQTETMTRPNFKTGDVFTTFRIDDVSLNPQGQLIMKGTDLKGVDSRGVALSMLEFGQVVIDKLVFKGCNDPKMFTAYGKQRVGVSDASTYQVTTGYMNVSNPTLSDILFKAFNCAPDIDTKPDFIP